MFHPPIARFVLLSTLGLWVAGPCRSDDLDPGNVPSPSIPERETGVASWYGHPYHGRQGANGEIYDMEKLTAAHRTLPFNTRVRVLDLRNDRTVEVRITDRGPFIDGRIIDLSLAAARAIDMVGPGTDPVALEVLEMPENAPPDVFAVQVGAFREVDNARNLCDLMQARYGQARMVFRAKDGLWRVLVGSKATQAGAGTLTSRVFRETGEAGFVVRVDSM